MNLEELNLTTSTDLEAVRDIGDREYEAMGLRDIRCTESVQNESSDSPHFGLVAEETDGANDPVKAYLKEMGRTPLLSKEDEVKLSKKIQDGFFEFDKVISTPDMMHIVGKLGRTLGPKGMMPNPKFGTVTKNVAQAVKEIKSGKIEYRVEKSGTLHCPFGRASFTAEKLQINLKILLNSVLKAKPASIKGQYLKRATISLTMGPGIRLNIAQI